MLSCLRKGEEVINAVWQQKEGSASSMYQCPTRVLMDGVCTVERQQTVDIEPFSPTFEASVGNSAHKALLWVNFRENSINSGPFCAGSLSSEPMRCH